MEKKRQTRMRGGVLIGVVLLLIIALVVGACAKAPAPAAPAPGAPTPTKPGAPTPAPGAPTPAPGATTPAPAAVKPIELIFSSGGLKTLKNAANYTSIWLMEEVKKRTGGRLVYKEYWGGALASATMESWELMKRGAIDYVSGLCPTCTSIEIFKWEIPMNSMLGLVKTPQESNRIARLMYTENAFQRAQWEDYGIKFAIPNMLGPYNIMSNTPIKTLDDLKGKKLYAWSHYTSLPYKAMGAVTVPSMPTGEFYDAIRSNLLQGGTKDILFVYANKFYEVAKYYTYTGFFGAMYGAPGVVNLKSFNALPDDIKKILEDLWLEADDKNIYYHEIFTKEAMEGLKDKVTFFSLSKEEIAKWQAAYGGMEGMAQAWFEHMEKKMGIPRAEAVRFLRRIQELAAPGWAIEDPNRPPDWVYKSPITGQTLPRIYPP